MCQASRTPSKAQVGKITQSELQISQELLTTFYLELLTVFILTKLLTVFILTKVLTTFLCINIFPVK